MSLKSTHSPEPFVLANAWRMYGGRELKTEGSAASSQSSHCLGTRVKIQPAGYRSVFKARE